MYALNLIVASFISIVGNIVVVVVVFVFVLVRLLLLFIVAIFACVLIINLFTSQLLYYRLTYKKSQILNVKFKT